MKMPKYPFPTSRNNQIRQGSGLERVEESLNEIVDYIYDQQDDINSKLAAAEAAAEQAGEYAEEAFSGTPEGYDSLVSDVGNLKSVTSGSILSPEWVDGKAIRYENGNEQSNASYSYTVFDISDYKKITITTLISSYAGIVFTTSDDAFISGINNPSGGSITVTLSIPENAKYLKVSCLKNSKGSFKIYSNLQNQIIDINTEIDAGYISNGSKVSFTDSFNAFIASTGLITPTTNTNFIVRKYPVEAGKTYNIKGTNVSVNYDTYGIASFSVLDYSGSTTNSTLIIFGTGATPTNYDVMFTPMTNGYIYIASYSTNPKADLYGAVATSKLIYKLTNANKDKLTLQAFGDSITDDSWRSDETTWLTVFPDYFPQRQWTIYNDAVGGSHMGHGKVNSDTGKYHELDYNWVYDLITNSDVFKPDADIIVIFAGTNDFNSFPLGEYGDDDTTTFYGAVDRVCNYLSANTAAKVFFVTPIARPADADTDKSVDANGEKINEYDKTLRDYANAIKQVCAFYQYPVIDLFYEIGWNATNVKPYMDSVGIHPNIKGSNAISQFICGAIKKYYGI